MTSIIPWGGSEAAVARDGGGTAASTIARDEIIAAALPMIPSPAVFFCPRAAGAAPAHSNATKTPLHAACREGRPALVAGRGAASRRARSRGDSVS